MNILRLEVQVYYGSGQKDEFRLHGEDAISAVKQIKTIEQSVTVPPDVRTKIGNRNGALFGKKKTVKRRKRG